METNKFIKIENVQDIKRLLLKINAKSILGLLSLDLSHGAKITYPYNEQLDKFLQPFEF